MEFSIDLEMKEIAAKAKDEAEKRGGLELAEYAKQFMAYPAIALWYGTKEEQVVPQYGIDGMISAVKKHDPSNEIVLAEIEAIASLDLQSDRIFHYWVFLFRIEKGGV